MTILLVQIVICLFLLSIFVLQSYGGIQNVLDKRLTLESSGDFTLRHKYKNKTIEHYTSVEAEEEENVTKTRKIANTKNGTDQETTRK